MAAAAVSPRGFHPSERTHRLAEPKKVRDVWNYSRRLVWGNQEPIWPLSQNALTGRPNPRTLELAQPKKKVDSKLQYRSFYAPGYNRESEFWQCPSEMSNYMTSERILHLSQPKQRSPIYLNRRPQSFSVWTNPSALSVQASQRILHLSQPRSLSPLFSFPKETGSKVTKASRKAVASPRTQLLAQPRTKKSIFCYDNQRLASPIRQVNPAALQSVGSSRLAELARPKAPPDANSCSRNPEWSVSAAAKKVVASPRIEELAQASKRASTNFVQFNPEAFTVKETAKRAVCTDRIRKLAEPVVH